MRKTGWVLQVDDVGLVFSLCCFVDIRQIEMLGIVVVVGIAALLRPLLPLAGLQELQKFNRHVQVLVIA